MKKREPISHIITTTILTANEADNLKKVVEKLKKNAIRRIPILKGKEVVGISNRTDNNRLTFGALFEGQEGADEAILDMLKIRKS